ncbi:MAG: ATP-binding cassette domain-containing protein [Actinomycetes bacterium]
MPELFELTGVTVTRGTGSDHVHPLVNVGATIRAGVCTVVVGPSGAGKSTLLRLLDRLEEPSSGEIRFHSKPLRDYDVLDLRRRVGLLQQQPVLLGDTVRADVTTARPQLADDQVAALLERAGLGPQFITRDTPSLSGGEAQRVCIARTLSLGPEVLLADEPTSALDEFATATVERTLRALVDDGLTTVLVTHDLRQARRLADDLIVVIAGSVVANGPATDVFAAAEDPRVRDFLAGAS